MHPKTGIRIRRRNKSFVRRIVDCFAAVNKSFLPENFVPVYLSEIVKKAEEFSKNWYDFEPSFEKWHIFSPNSSFYLDLDYYSCLDCLNDKGVWIGGYPDKKLTLVVVRGKKAIDIIPTNSANGADDAFWVNDSMFVMLCSDYDFQKEEAEPYISKWNKEKPITCYSYDGKINNLYDERFSPFFKRLKRLGIKY
jgi:hypothetical protein